MVGALLIPGINASRMALSQGKVKIREILIKEGKKGPRSGEIIEMAAERGVDVKFVKGKKLDHLLPSVAHQGVVAVAEEFQYTPFEELVGEALKTPGYSLLLVADHITDEGNLGSLVRTGAFFGVHGLVLPKDRSAKVTETVIKRSAGGWFSLPIARVVNLGRSLDELNRKGFWIVGASVEGSESIYEFDWNRDAVLILGNEAKGLSQSTAKRCHQLVRIPCAGPMDSLNVSVAGGIILAEIMRQRSRVAS
ncbi:MAG: 23S rRNA (guanosine(2251)-2'-O)-methyltransferase RlmB [Deltaproteobacteria bacterium]|nr:23S rRNA (guanosine(2251)-2'-O)-methyltransferase RlmB [Deltaproteobacteria bacterium]